MSSPANIHLQSTRKLSNPAISLEVHETVLKTRCSHSWQLSFLKSFSLVSKALASKKEEKKKFKTAKANRMVRVLISSSKTAHILGF